MSIGVTGCEGGRYARLVIICPISNQAGVLVMVVNLVSRLQSGLDCESDCNIHMFIQFREMRNLEIMLCILYINTESQIVH